MSHARVLEYWGVAWRPKQWLKSLNPAVSTRSASRALGVSDTIVHNWDTAGFTPLSAYKALWFRFGGTRTPKPPAYSKAELAFRLSLATHALALNFDERYAGLNLPKAPDAAAAVEVAEPDVPPRKRQPRVTVGDAAPAPAETELEALARLLARGELEREALQARIQELERDLEMLTAPKPAVTSTAQPAPTTVLSSPRSAPRLKRTTLQKELERLQLPDGLEIVVAPKAERQWRKLSPESAEQFERTLIKLALGEPVQRKLMEGVQHLTSGDRVWSVRASQKHRLLYHQDGSRITVAAFAERGDKEFYRHEA